MKRTLTYLILTALLLSVVVPAMLAGAEGGSGEPPAKTPLPAITSLSQDSFEYNGSARKPKVTIEGLAEDIDFTVSYARNTNAGSGENGPAAIATGIGNYEGTQTKSFTITPANLPAIDAIGNQTYAPGGVRPSVTFGGQALTSDDVTISYSNNTSATTEAKVTAVGKGNYEGEQTKLFTITPANLPAIDAIGNQTYAPGGVRPSVTFGGQALTSDDVTVSYTDNTSVTTEAKVTAVGQGNYQGTQTAIFTIVPAPLPAISTISPDAFDYDGNAKEPTVAINGLVEGTDFSVGFERNINAGSGSTGPVAIATAKEKSNYTGSSQKSFTINPIALPDIVSIASQKYTSEQIKPVPTFSDPKIMEDDITVTYGANRNVGQGTVSVTGKRNYTGTKTATFDITSRALPAIANIDPQTYTGAALKPAVTMVFGMDNPLVEGRDYDLSYENNELVGTNTAKVKAVGKGNYTGEQTKPFTILPAELPDIKPVSAVEYNGLPHRPDVEMSNVHTGRLVKDTDYKLSYKKNTNKGTATITVEGLGNYAGTKTTTFEITAKLVDPPAFTASFVFDGKAHKPVTSPASSEYQLSGDLEKTDVLKAGYTAIAKLADPENTAWNAPGEGIKDYVMKWAITPIALPTPADVAEQVYTSEAITPPVVMSNTASGTLVLDRDYKTIYSKNLNVGLATIAITGINNYEGSKLNVGFKIVPAALPAIEKMASLVYTGDKLTPPVTMNFGKDKPLQVERDYSLAYVDNLNVGTATVTATGMKNYKDTSKQTFAITPAELPQIAPLPAVDFNGKAHTPDVVMSNKFTGPLVKDKDYTLSYKENTNAGTATITVTGIGNYQNSKEVTFVINPIDMPEITAIPDQSYTGAALEPAILMKDEASGDLVKDRDFTVKYAQNTDGAMINSEEIKKPLATVTGIGNYKGVKTIEFVIVDTKAPVFNSSEAKMANATLRISGRDDWGLKSVRVIRNGTVLTEENYSSASPRVLSYDYEVLFMIPGSYQVFATDLYNHTVNLYNTSGKEEDLLTAGRYYGDTDNDGLTDVFEVSIDTDPKNPDTDGDGLTDGEEHLKYHTNPLQSDTDGDGISDGDEIKTNYFDPNRYDTDLDGISDTVEAIVRDSVAANEHKSSLALELLLNANRAALKPAMSADELQKALADLDEFKLIGALNNPYTAAAERTKVQFSPVDGQGKRVVQGIVGPETMLVKLNPQGEQLAVFQHTLLKFTANEKGRFGMSDALNLNLLTDKNGAAVLSLSDAAKADKDVALVMSDRNGTLLLLASWNAAEQKTDSDLILVDTANMKAYQVPNSTGASRFDVAPGGSKAAYLLNGELYLIDLKGTNLEKLSHQATLLGFTENDQLIIGLSGGKATIVQDDKTTATVDFTGVVYVEQPTNNYRNAILVKDGIETAFAFTTGVSISGDGRVVMRALPSAPGAETVRPAFNSVRLFDNRDPLQRKVKSTLMNGILN